jgi:Tetratricopeptide repeat
MRSAMTIFISVSLWLGGGIIVHAQDRSASSLSGIVKAVRGVQISGFTRVRLERSGITIQEKIVTDGRFEFRNIASGSYALVVEAAGYQTSYTAVEFPGESFVLVELDPARHAKAGKPETRSLLMYLLDANRLDEAEKLARQLHQNAKHGADVHLVLGKIYVRQGKKAEAMRELELYVEEAPRSPLREEAQRALSGR